MKKLLLTVVALAALTLMAAPHSSYADFPVNGVMGLYFDGGASCTTTAPYTPFNIYIVYMNYNAASIKAFEAGLVVEPTGSLIFTGATYPANATVLGNPGDGGNDANYLAGFSEAVALPANGDGFTLATLSVVASNANPISITLNAGIPSSDLSTVPRPVVQADPGTGLELEIADWAQAEGSPTLVLNPAGDCGVTLPTEDMSFGGVKSLFR